MSSTYYDIVAIGDFRFPGGTSSAVAEELRAQAAAGYRTGLIQLKGPVLKYPHPINPKVRACLDEGLADLLDPDAPVAARLVLAHHPSLFTHLPHRALRIEAEARLLIVHHPPFDGFGQPNYDCAPSIGMPNPCSAARWSGRRSARRCARSWRLWTMHRRSWTMTGTACSTLVPGG